MVSVRLVRAAALFAAVGAVTLAQLNLPDRAFWDAQQPALYVAVAILAIAASLEAIESVSAAVQQGKIQQFDDTLRAAFGAAVGGTLDAFGTIRSDDIAVYRYELRGRWRPQLVRVGAVRAGAPISDHHRRLKIDRGINGFAFTDRMTTAEEWNSIVSNAISTMTPDQWEAQAHQAKFGLDWGELMRSERGAGIVSTPTFDEDGEVNGCVSIIAPLKKHELLSSDMQSVLSDLTSAFDLAGQAPRGWWRYSAR